MKMNKKKIILLIVLGILLVAGICLTPLFLKLMTGSDFKTYLTVSGQETGTEFTPLKDTEKAVADMVLAAENENLKLYTNLTTTEVALYDKRSGKIYYSNPADRAERLGSETDAQFTVTYYDSSRQRLTMNNYTMSVAKEQFTVEALENGIRYTYTLGDFSSETGIVPRQISTERLEMFLSNVSESDAKNVKKRYKVSEDDPEMMVLLDSAITSINIKRMTAILTEAGYTQEDYELDMADTEESEKIGFMIPLDYRLTEDGVEIRIETDQIKEFGEAKIYNIQLMRYFGAANTEEEGYIFVPNGSGSLIYFNNGKSSYGYTQYVYDVDPTVASFVVLENTTTAQLPVYGLKYEEGALFAVITQGDALARIDAGVSGNASDYNNVYTTFYLRGFELLEMFGTTGAQADLPVVEDNLYETTLAVEYIPLSGDDADYSGMANYYRNRLIREGVLGDALANSNLPFYLDVIGGVNVSNNIAGINYDKVVKMTTYEQALEIAENLTESGVSNIRMNYLGWFNGGYYHDVADKITDATKLGSKSDISRLNEYLEMTDGGLYGNVAFNTVKYGSDRYLLSQEAAKYYAGKSLVLSDVCPYTLRRGNDVLYEETVCSVLSPRYLDYYVEHFLEEFADYDMNGIAARDLANVLTSDKKRTDFIDRQMALEITRHAFETLEASGNNLLVYGGNAYSFAYADDIIDAPLTASQFMIVDEEIPFYEMIIHGYINYAGAELNLMQAADRTELLLELIETGAAPRYVVSYENSDLIKYSGMNDMYSVRYDLYEEEMKNFYSELELALGDVVNVPMIKHEKLAEDVSRITYENGVILYVNRSEKDVYADGIRIPAGWYSKEGK